VPRLPHLPSGVRALRIRVVRAISAEPAPPEFRVAVSGSALGQSREREMAPPPSSLSQRRVSATSRSSAVVRGARGGLSLVASALLSYSPQAEQPCPRGLGSSVRSGMAPPWRSGERWLHEHEHGLAYLAPHLLLDRPPPPAVTRPTGVICSLLQSGQRRAPVSGSAAVRNDLV
jgi:hypothetical protein